MKTVFSTLSVFLSRRSGALVANTAMAGHSARPKRVLPALGSCYGHAFVLDVSASTESGLCRDSRVPGSLVFCLLLSLRALKLPHRHWEQY